VGRHDLGAHLDGAVPRALGQFGVDGHVVAHGELDLVPVEQVHGPVFGVVAVQLGRQLALDKDGRAVLRPHGQLGLEEPGLVLASLGLLLGIDQE
jgi:hypothetical protein